MATVTFQPSPEMIAAANQRHRALDGLPPEGDCEKCNKSPATGWWLGDNSWMDVNRGYTPEGRCELCCLDAEIEACEKMAAKLSELRQKRNQFTANRSTARHDQEIVKPTAEGSR